MNKFLLLGYSIICSAVLIFPLEVQWQNPFPPTNYFLDVNCPSRNTAIAVGHKGVILRTKDYGLTWNVINMKIWEDLSRVYFIDSLKGWILGAKGSLLNSTNGGETWQKIPFDTSINLSYYCSSINNNDYGWMRGYSEINSHFSYFLFRTKNGGLEWEKLSLDPNNTPSIICFLDTLKGIATTTASSKDRLLRTDDGGITWSKVITPDNFYARHIQFIDAVNGWAAPSFIWRTRDSGNTWIKEIPSTGVEFKAMHFLDTLQGWMVGRLGSSSGIAAIVHTSDGGKSCSIDTIPEYSLNGVHLYDKTTGFAVGNDSNLNGAILRAKDSGTSWEVCGKGTHHHLLTVFPIDSKTCFAAGEGGIIFKTEDGGINWLEQRVRADSAITDMYFSGSDTGWAVGWYGYVIKTVDGGQSWQEQNSNTNKSLLSAYFVNSQVGYIGGDSGTVLRTVNGGDTWQPVINNTAHRYYGLHFTSASTGFATPYYDVNILRTIDSGKTWTPIPTSTNIMFLSISFADSLTGYALGRGGFYYYVCKSEDGGITWDSLSEVGGDKVWIHAKSRDTVYVCGIVGGIRRSTDGGKSWTYITPLMGFYTDETMQCIRFARNSSVGWAVGTSGAIIRIVEDGEVAIKNNLHPSKKAKADVQLEVVYKGIKGSEHINIRYILKKSDIAAITIFTVKGARIATVLRENPVTAGIHSLRFDVSGLGAGMYVCKLECKSGVATQKFEIVK